MPKLLRARPPLDAAEERRIRKLAGSRHAPGDWIRRARMIARSWDEPRTAAIAHELGCHPQTVRERRLRFNAERLDGLGDRPGSGRKPRLTEAERGVILGLVATDPPGRLARQPHGELAADDERGPACWTLDALAAAARAHGVRIQRGQIRRIFLAAGARWRDTRSWSVSRDPAFGPNPVGDLYLIGDNLSSHKSPPIAAWLEARPRVRQVFIPVGACWLNLQEAWWRLFRREAVAGQSFVDAAEIDHATAVVTTQLNRRAKPWVWNRPPKPARYRRRAFVYCL